MPDPAETAELEAALTMSSAEALADRTRDAAEAGDWYATAVLAIAAWRAENGRRIAPRPLMAHVELAFGRPLVEPDGRKQ